MKKTNFKLFLISLILIPSLTFAAPNITIDGNMGADEWAGYFTNDNGVGSGGFVDPGWGGQDFDIERIGIYFDDTYLYIGLQTGFELNYQEQGEYPGNIAIGFNTDNDLGTEDYQFALKFNFGSFQGEDMFDFTNYYLSKIDNLADANLEIYNVNSWQTVQFNSTSGGPYPYRVATNGGESIGMVEPNGGTVSYNRYDSNGNPYTVNNNNPYYNTIEAAIRLDQLSDTLSEIGIDDLSQISNASIFWTMSCNNDMAGHTYTRELSHTPEPESFLLFGMSLIGASALGRRRMNKEA